MLNLEMRNHLVKFSHFADKETEEYKWRMKSPN